MIYITQIHIFRVFKKITKHKSTIKQVLKILQLIQPLFLIILQKII